MKTQTKKQLLDAVGGLSKPSKMPGYGWSIPATMCPVGSRLRGVEGSVCSKCYALKGRYVFPNVLAAMNRRFAIWQNDRKAWVNNMANAINRVSNPDKKTGWAHFRWFDSGDLLSRDMLDDIVEVCLLTPGVRHWLPTKEYKLVREFFDHNDAPVNLTIRVSSPMLWQAPLEGFPNTSTVVKEGATCPSSKQGNSCGDCRACWYTSVPNVSYGAH